jgi:hypothetical protein
VGDVGSNHCLEAEPDRVTLNAENPQARLTTRDDCGLFYGIDFGLDDPAGAFVLEDVEVSPTSGDPALVDVALSGLEGVFEGQLLAFDDTGDRVLSVQLSAE